MVDVTSPDAITFAKAAEILPRDSRGRMVRHLTMVRWATKGVGGVVLDSARLGRTWFTSRAAISAFTDASARSGGKSGRAPMPDASAERECELLEAMGI